MKQYIKIFIGLLILTTTILLSSCGQSPQDKFDQDQRAALEKFNTQQLEKVTHYNYSGPNTGTGLTKDIVE